VACRQAFFPEGMNVDTSAEGDNEHSNGIGDEADEVRLQSD
jgi:hypothetical protein